MKKERKIYDPAFKSKAVALSNERFAVFANFARFLNCILVNIYIFTEVKL